MQVKSKIFRWVTILGVILLVQTLTFYLISHRQLEGRLLPDHFQFCHHSDRAYVRDFYGAAEDPPIFTSLSHDLKNDQEKLKKKLKVKFVYFEQPREKSQVDEKSFDLVYYTWIQRGDWLTLSNFFKMKQIEHVVVDKMRIYKREVIYQWCLFFWIRSSEFIQSDDLATEG